MEECTTTLLHDLNRPWSKRLRLGWQIGTIWQNKCSVLPVKLIPRLLHSRPHLQGVIISHYLVNKEARATKNKRKIIETSQVNAGITSMLLHVRSICSSPVVPKNVLINLSCDTIASICNLRLYIYIVPLFAQSNAFTTSVTITGMILLYLYYYQHTEEVVEED